jgi:hypothetical protein
MFQKCSFWRIKGADTGNQQCAPRNTIFKGIMPTVAWSQNDTERLGHWAFGGPKVSVLARNDEQLIS